VRNISRTGMGCLHTTFLHPGSIAQMIIVDESRQPLLRMNGKVVRCEQIKVRVFDVGIVFAEKVPLETILPVAAHDDSQNEHAELLKNLEVVRSALMRGDAGDGLMGALESLQTAVNARLQASKNEAAAKPAEADAADAHKE
jgi:hypothetical protein